MKKAKKILILLGFLAFMFLLKPPFTRATTCSMDSTGGDYSVTESCTFGYDTTTRTISDNTSNGNRGIATGTTVVEGKYGSARSFNGSSDVVEIEDHSSLDIGSKITITGWFNVTDTATYRPLVWKNQEYLVRIDPDGTFNFFLYDGEDWEPHLSAASNPTTGEWHHFAAVYDSTLGSNHMKLYIDGDLSSQQDRAITTSPTTNNLFMGIAWSTYFYGKLDDVRIYDYARTEDQVEEDMNNHPSPTGDAPVGHWTMDDGYVNGVDNGNLTVTSGNTLTINAGQTIVWNPGKSITIEDGASIAINTTGSLKQSYLWVSDPDNDGWYVDDTLVASDTQPTNYVRRYTTIGSALGDGSDGSVTINSNTNLNLTAVAAGRSVADAISYKVASLGSNTATRQTQTLDTEAWWKMDESSGTTVADSSDAHDGTIGPNDLWLKMDESSGTTVADSSGNGRDGTATGGDHQVWWKMDETGNNSCSGGEDVCDSSGNAIHGTATGTTIINGVYGKARYFNGSSDYVESNDANVFDDLTEFTIEMWVYHQSVSGGDHDIITKGTHASSNPLVFWRDEASTDHYALLITDNGGDYSGVLYSAYVPQLQTATHVAITFETENQIRMYFDGVEDANSPFSIPSISAVKKSTQPIRLGTDENGGSWFYGVMDDVRIYNHARTQSEIEADMNNGDGPSRTPPSIVAGKYGNARSFNGDDQYIEVAGYTGVGGSRARTVEAWIKTNSATDQGIVSWGENSAGEKYTVRLDVVGDNTVLRVEVNGGYEYGTTNLADGTWHHLAVVLPTGGSNVTDHLLYVDGNLESSTTTLSQSMATATTSNVIIGNSILPKFFNGEIDDVRIYRHERLQAQVQEDMNNSTGPSIVTGKYGNAKSFNGTTDYISLGTNEFGTLGDFTVMAWVKTSASSEQVIISEYEIGVCGDALLRISTTGTVDFHNGAASWNYGDTPVNDGTWHHVTYAYDGSNGMIYIDGEPETDTTGTPWKDSCSDQDVVIGNRMDQDKHFNGEIDELRVYNYARTESQIKEDMLDPTNLSGVMSGDNVLLINLQGSSTYNANVGNYEMLKVESVTDSVATFSSNIRKIYGASDSNSDLTDQKIIIQRIPQYSDLAISSGEALTAYAWDGTKGGVFAIQVSGTFTGTGTINMDSKGYRGGDCNGCGNSAWGDQGEGIVGQGTGSLSANENGGGGGYGPSGFGGDPGAGGGHASAGGDGVGGGGTAIGGSAVGEQTLGTIFMGGGAGAGGDNDGATPFPQYVDGGGIVIVYAKTISSINATADGEAGIGATSAQGGAATGGGAGGSILLKGADVTLTSVTATGGAGGDDGAGDVGGAGSDGRVAIHYLYTQSGSSSPSAYTEQIAFGPISTYLAQEGKSNKNQDLLGSLITSLQNLQQH